MKKLLLILFLITAVNARSQTIFPFKISENKRYFTTQQGKPFLYHDDTNWKIFTELSTAEAVEYLSFRKSQVFNTIYPANWRQIVNYPGANQMGNFIKFFESIPSWEHSLDVRHQAVVAGYWQWSKADFKITAVKANKKLIVSHLPEIQVVYVDLNFLSGDSFTCAWYNPATGKNEKEFTINKKTVQQIFPAGARRSFGYKAKLLIYHVG